MRLGYFDGLAVPYRNLTWADVNTPHAQSLAKQAAVEGITLLKNDNGMLPLKLSNTTSIALIGDWANATTQMQGNYHGVPPYLHGPLYAAQQLGVTINYATGPSGQGDPTTDGWYPSVWDAANNSDIIIYAGGIDNSVEAEGMDRMSLDWTGAQLDVIGQLAMYGKPMTVLQMGGGQIDSSPIRDNSNISALLWGGYPGQDGGTALFDILTGKSAPAGRLPSKFSEVLWYANEYLTNLNSDSISFELHFPSPNDEYVLAPGREQPRPNLQMVQWCSVRVRLWTALH